MAINRRHALIAATGLIAAPALIGRAVRSAHADAPMQTGTGLRFRRFRIGEFEVTTLLDGARIVDRVHPTFGSNQPAEAVSNLMRENLLPETKVQFSYTPTLVNTGKELILFDAGNATEAQPGRGNTMANMRAAGYAPGLVDIVVFTHFHGDHIGGAATNRVPNFLFARYVAGAVENNTWAKIAADKPDDFSGKLYNSNVKPQLDKFTLINPGDSVVSGITAIESYGHTMGHMSFLLESDGSQLLIWGDVANHFVASVQRPDWHVGFDQDKEMAAATRRRIFDMVATDRIPVVAYHSPFPAVGLIEAKNGGYRWIPETYQIDVMNHGKPPLKRRR